MRILFTFLLLILFFNSYAQSSVKIKVDSLFTIEFPDHPKISTAKRYIDGVAFYEKELSFSRENQRYRVLKSTGDHITCASRRKELRDNYKTQSNLIVDTITGSYKIDTFGVSLQNDIYVSDLYYSARNRTYEIKMIQVQDTLYHFIHDFDSSVSHIGISNEFIGTLKSLPELNEKSQFSDCKNDNNQFVNESAAYQKSYEFGQKIAPFICIGFVVLTIGGIVLLIINIQKKKRKREQEEFDRYNS